MLQQRDTLGLYVGELNAILHRQGSLLRLFQKVWGGRHQPAFDFDAPLPNSCRMPTPADVLVMANAPLQPQEQFYPYACRGWNDGMPVVELNLVQEIVGGIDHSAHQWDFGVLGPPRVPANWLYEVHVWATESISIADGFGGWGGQS